MGHHQDDNVETTIWRLCTGARGAGLAGIPAVASIPECHGLYGVSGSGSFLTLASSDADKWRVTATGEVIGVEVDVDTDPMPRSWSRSRSRTMGYRVSTGSVRVCRPLLGLPKRYLVETCLEHSIPFVEDPTNFDPTLTPRNAIRALRSENRLPRALGTQSVLSLIAKSRALLDTSARLSDEVLKRCNILRLDLAAGWMVLRFPSSTEVTSNHQILTVALRRITEVISPFPDAHFPFRSFAEFTGRVFPSQTKSKTVSDSKDRQSFTLGGVLFRPLHCRPSSTYTTTASTEEVPENEDTGNIWLLTRQPFMRHRLPSLDFNVSVSPVGDLEYTPWTLWDNRYWIRLGVTQQQQQQQQQNTETTSHIPIRIRPLQRADIQRLRNYFPKSKFGAEHPVWKGLRERLSRDAPGSARFTVPVLVAGRNTVGIEGLDGEEDVLLALPTLGIRLPLSSGVEWPWPWEVYWEWMFKEIDRATVTSMGLFIEGDNS